MAAEVWLYVVHSSLNLNMCVELHTHIVFVQHVQD